MTWHIPVLFFFLAGVQSACQHTYLKEIAAYRDHLKTVLTAENQGPLTESDLVYLDYFEPDPEWIITGQFDKITTAQPIDLANFDGTSSQFLRFGKFRAEIQGDVLTLTLFQDVKTLRNPLFRKRLFVPFRDLTNGDSTYPGGRYLELSTDDISDGLIVVDFNKTYNPYCVYSDDYSCPIPPAENRLDIHVTAGEKMFVRGKE